MKRIQAFVYAVLVMGLALQTVPAVAENAEIEDLRLAETLNRVREVCEVPDEIHPYSESVLNRFVAQVFYPELKMLTTAFLRGFTWTSSRLIQNAYCIGLMMNQPLDPAWEANLDLIRGVREHNNPVPDVLFVRVDEKGDVIWASFEGID